MIKYDNEEKIMERESRKESWMETVYRNPVYRYFLAIFCLILLGLVIVYGQ